VKKKRKKDQLFPCLISSCLYPEILWLSYLLSSLSSLLSWFSFMVRCLLLGARLGAPPAAAASTGASRGAGSELRSTDTIYQPRRPCYIRRRRPPALPSRCGAGHLRRGQVLAATHATFGEQARVDRRGSIVTVADSQLQQRKHGAVVFAQATG
jgi:hypothetical protein